MSALISDDYRAMNKELHARGNYGVMGATYAPMVREIVNGAGIATILDYGAGQCRLAKSMPDLEFRNYDPAVVGLDGDPEPADLVTCTDVLEHIEPECLDEVLDHISRLALRHVFLVVATRPAAKFLADGRNAHLIQEPVDWWLPKLTERWTMQLVQATPGEFIFVGAKK